MTLEEFALRIPKIELHLHLEGSVRPGTLVDLSRKNGISLPPYRDISELYIYDNLLDFLGIYDLVCRSIRTREDFARISFEALENCAQDGARYVEFFFSPHAHISSGITYSEMLDGIFDGMSEAHARHGIESALIPAHSRVLGPEQGIEFVRMVLADRRPGILGIGLDYDELPNNPALFHAMYDLARSGGLHVTAHAGEVGPPQFVREALDDLRVGRIDHGYHIVDDPSLVAECRRRGTFFTCCPSTTLTTTVWRDLKDPQHAIRRMLDEGLRITINSDDPPMFRTSLAHEFLLCVREMGFTAEQLKSCSLHAIEASWLDEMKKKIWRMEWSREIDGMIDEIGTI